MLELITHSFIAGAAFFAGAILMAGITGMLHKQKSNIANDLLKERNELTKSTNIWHQQIYEAAIDRNDSLDRIATQLEKNGK